MGVRLPPRTLSRDPLSCIKPAGSAGETRDFSPGPGSALSLITASSWLEGPAGNGGVWRLPGVPTLPV